MKADIDAAGGNRCRKGIALVIVLIRSTVLLNVSVLDRAGEEYGGRVREYALHEVSGLRDVVPDGFNA